MGGRGCRSIAHRVSQKPTRTNVGQRNILMHAIYALVFAAMDSQRDFVFRIATNESSENPKQGFCELKFIIGKFKVVECGKYR